MKVSYPTALVVTLFFMSSTGVDAQKTNTIALTAEDCVLRALDRNLSSQSRQMEFNIAEMSVSREWAAFEPALVASARNEENNRENTVEQFRNQLSSFFSEQNSRYDLGVEGLFFSGARYRLGYSLNDLSNNLTNSIVTTPFESQYQSFLGATLTQPLLRGAGLSAAMTGVNLAKSQRGVEWQNLRREMMAVAAQSEAAFWDLALAEDLLTIRGNSVKIARQIMDDNRERNKQGKIAEMEVMQAEANLADRQTRENEARQQKVQAVSKLRTMFSEEADEHQPDLTVRSVPEVKSFQHELDAAMNLATRLQPDYLAQLEEIKQNELRLAYAANQRWPQLDLIGSYGFNGLSDTMSGSWDEAVGQDYDAWSIGLQLSVGLGGDRKVRTEMKIADMRKLQSLTKLKEIELTIYQSLKAGIEECRSLKENINNITRVVDVRKQLLDMEMERLNAGRGDSRSVFVIEEDLLLAKEAYARSVNEYQKAMLRLELASGLTLAKWGLDERSSDEPAATVGSNSKKAKSDNPMTRGSR